MLVQAECNEACFNCRGAAEYVSKLGTKLQKNLHHSSSDGDFLLLNIVTSFIYRGVVFGDLRNNSEHQPFSWLVHNPRTGVVQ